MTNLADLQDQIQKYVSPRFTKELRANMLLAGLVSKEYEGEIKEGGDEVTVTQLVAPTGNLATIGTDADTYKTEKLVATSIKIKADKRAIAAHKFADLVKIQSIIDGKGETVLEGLRFAISRQVNNYLYSLVAPHASMLQVSANLNKAAMLSARLKAAQNLWQEPNWFMLADPVYYTDLLGDTALASRDFAGDDVPLINGKVGSRRLGFAVAEDNSRTTQQVLAFHPDFLHMVSQTEVTFKISDLHANGQFGYVMSADLIFGAKQGIGGDKKHLTIKTA
jgi:hypothetical protein